MQAKPIKFQGGTISLLVISFSTLLLSGLAVMAALGELAPFVCVLARGLGLPSLS